MIDASMPDDAHFEINRVRALVHSGLDRCTEDELSRFLEVINRYDAAAQLHMTQGLRQPVENALERKGQERRHAESMQVTRSFFEASISTRSIKDSPGLNVRSERRTVTVMFTDMKGYSTLVGQDETAGLKILSQLDSVIASCITTHNGQLIKGMGDGCMICFQSALDALQCGFAIQNSVSNLRHGDDAIQIRVGINTGDVLIKESGDLHGEVVNNAKRLETQCHPAWVCVSESVRQNIPASERKQFVFQEEEEVFLKGAAEPVKCWHVIRATHPNPPIPKTQFTPNKSTANPAIFFNDVTELTVDRAGDFKFSSSCGKMYLRLYPKYAVPHLNSELEAKKMISGSRLKPLGRSTSWGADRNAYGAINFESTSDGTINHLVQLFLSRELWAIDCVVLDEDRIRTQLEQWGQPHHSPKYIASTYLEQCFVECLEEFLKFGRDQLQLPLPLFIEAGIVGIKGYSVTVSSWQFSGKALRDTVSWADQIDSFEKPSWEILDGFFNKIWVNCGLERPTRVREELADFGKSRR